MEETGNVRVHKPVARKGVILKYMPLSEAKSEWTA
jgi:hypothetical protein